MQWLYTCNVNIIAAAVLLCSAALMWLKLCSQVLAAVADNGTCSLWAWEKRLQITLLDLPKGADLHSRAGLRCISRTSGDPAIIHLLIHKQLSPQALCHASRMCRTIHDTPHVLHKHHALV